jgi:hypothetical protein
MDEFTKINISFASKNQVPYLMIIKEYYDGTGEIHHADILYQENDPDSICIITGAENFRPLVDGKVQIMGPLPKYHLREV